MAATVAHVSALILNSPATTSPTTSSKLSDCGGTGAGSLGGGGEFAKRLDEAKGASSASAGTTPAIVVLKRPKRPSKPPRSGTKPPNGVMTPKKPAPPASEDQRDGAPAENAGATGEAAETAGADADSETPDQSADVTRAQAQEPASGDDGQAPLTQSALAGVAAAVSAPTAQATLPTEQDGPERQASQRAPIQPVIVANAAEQSSHMASDAAPPGYPAVMQSKAQETAAAFEKSLAAAAGPRKTAAAGAPPPVQDVPQEAGVKPANQPVPEGKQPQMPPAAADLQASVDAGVATAKDDAKVSEGSGDDVEKLGQIAAHDGALPQPHAMARDGGVVRSQQPAAPAEARFAETNHANIVSGVRTTLLPHGGSMQIRLDPPELGALQVIVEMRDGAMTAMFQTSNDDATRLLSHSLGQLKTALESQGVTVEKIQVQQAPKDHQATNYEDQSRQQQRDDANARQEQQRREMLRRMWRRISGGVDPVDLVA